MTATCAIIPASGLGERLTKSSGKSFVPVGGSPLISHTLAAFQECAVIDVIVLVVRKEDVIPAQELVSERAFSKVAHIVVGGAQRQDSVRNGLAAVPHTCDIVVIHDGARPLVDCEVIDASINAAREYGASIVAVPVIDTIKSTSDGRFVDQTLDRRELYAVQTPQTFKVGVIRSAYESAYEDGFVGTDDASLVERLGLPVAIVRGAYENLKVTTPPDIILAEALMRERCCDTGARGFESDMDKGTSMRVGHGYDIHRFAEGRTLVLGGVKFPGEVGLLGHSDADVLLHAVADAVLGAAGSGDIGHLFPDTDAAYKDADSMDLLRRVGDVIRGLGWKIGNVDVTLIAEKPRIAKYVPEMRSNIAGALEMHVDLVSVKATTAEGLGSIGQGSGIECHAVCALFRR
ncbi:MAG TPA: 2-C-methyl-D-erythritol 4-phosphate cytidylyltransferase [Armatimonadota bacterium]